MPRRDVTFTQGGYYHIYNRGARRVSIFREARNYAYVTRLMQRLLTGLLELWLREHNQITYKGQRHAFTRKQSPP